MTPEQIEAARILAASGWPRRKVARALNVPETSLRRNGVESTCRTMGRVSAWDTDLLVSLARHGYSRAEIAEITGADRGAIQHACKGIRSTRRMSGRMPPYAKTMRILTRLIAGEAIAQIADVEHVSRSRVDMIRKSAIDEGII